MWQAADPVAAEIFANSKVDANVEPWLASLQGVLRLPFVQALCFSMFQDALSHAEIRRCLEDIAV